MGNQTLKIILLLVVLIINIILFLCDIEVMHGAFYLVPLISVVACLITVVSLNAKVKVIYFPLAGILYFNFQWYILSLFDRKIASELTNTYGVASEYFLKANYLLGISLAAICIGYSLWVKKAKKVPNTTLRQLNAKNYVTLLPIQLVNLMLLFMAIASTGFFVGSTFVGTSSIYYIYLFRVILIVIVATYYIKYVLKKPISKASNVLTYLMTIIFIIYVSIGGDRGPILMILLMVGFAWLLNRNMKISIIELFILIVAVYSSFIFFKIIESFRLLDAISLSVDIIIDSYKAFADSPYKPDDLIRATMITMQNIDNGIFHHTLGINFLVSLLKSIPGLGGYVLREFSDDGSVFSSAELISVFYYGKNYSSGFGTTYLAELYLEFGVFGVLTASLAYGCFVGSLESRIHNHSKYSFNFNLMLFIFIGLSFYVGRSQIAEFLVYYIHTYIIFIFIQFFASKSFKLQRSN